MNCSELRDRLMSGAHAGAGAGANAGPDAGGLLAEHLAGCPSCSRFAARLAAVRGALRDRPEGPRPDAGFSLRVRARLPRGSELLGWAALRALPAALALVLALAWMSSSEPPSVETLLSAEPSPDLLLTTGALSLDDPR